MNNIFLDNAATTKTDPRVVEKMLPFFTENFGNPSGMHSFSLQAKQALLEARQTVAQILNCELEEIIFTGSGTESDNLAIFGITGKNATPEKNHCLTSKIEHHAVLYPFEKLQIKGFEVTFLQPTKEGEVTPDIFKKAITQKTFFASVMFANNEIGTVNPITQLAQLAHEQGIIFHTDACQVGGTHEVNVKKLGVDLMTLNGSKIYGPKGVGVLFKKKSVKIEPQILGGRQEWNLRAGTENVAGIVGFTEALKLAKEKKEQENLRLQNLQQRIIDFVLKEIPLSRLNGHPTKRLPNNVHFSFLNTEGETLLFDIRSITKDLQLRQDQHAVRTVSNPSHVLMGIGMPHEVSHGSVRITLGKDTTENSSGAIFEDSPSGNPTNSSNVVCEFFGSRFQRLVLD